jgi:methyl-accepting chemotaxis protein
MSKLSLSKQIGIGFTLMLIIILTMGLIGSTSISKAINNSEKLDKQYVKEVEIAGHIERSFANVRIAIGKFIYTEDEKYKKLSDTSFIETYKYIAEAEELAKKYPDLVKLKASLKPMTDKIKEYQNTVEKIHTTFLEKKSIRAKLDENAKIFMQKIRELNKEQKERLQRDIKKGVNLDKQLNKVYLAFQAEVYGYDARIANFKSAARRDSSILTNGLKDFDKLNKIFSSLINVTVRQINIDRINAVKDAGNDYKKELLNLQTSSKKVEEYSKTIVTSGTAALKAVQDVNNAGLTGTSKLSKESIEELDSSKSTMLLV